MTNLIQRNWKNSIEHLREEVNSMFDRWMPRRRIGSDGDTWDFWSPSTISQFEPAMDLEETDKEIRVVAELPGLEKDDFSVEVTGNRLVIRGERKSEREEKGRDYFFSERNLGAFSRSIELPCEVDFNKADAQYKNGVLKIRLPKTEAAQAKRITVHVA